MKANDVEAKCERDVDLIGDVNLSTARRPTYAPRRVHVDFPGSMISAPDLKTVRLGTAAIRAACSSV